MSKEIDFMDIIKQMESTGCIVVQDMTKAAFILNKFVCDMYNVHQSRDDDYIRKQLRNKITQRDLDDAGREGYLRGYEDAMKDFLNGRL